MWTHYGQQLFDWLHVIGMVGANRPTNWSTILTKRKNEWKTATQVDSAKKKKKNDKKEKNLSLKERKKKNSSYPLNCHLQ